MSGWKSVDELPEMYEEPCCIFGGQSDIVLIKTIQNEIELGYFYFYDGEEIRFSSINGYETSVLSIKSWHEIPE